MNKDFIDNIINESIANVLNEDFFGEKKNEHHKDDGIGDLIKNYLHKHHKKNKKKKIKLRKMAGGRSSYYDFDEYQKSNKDVAQGDASSIRNSIDMEKTNIASVARDLFPDHTEEGAQSQLRKILNGERPMTNKIASKIEKMISKGNIATK